MKFGRIQNFTLNEFILMRYHCNILINSNSYQAFLMLDFNNIFVGGVTMSPLWSLPQMHESANVQPTGSQGYYRLYLFVVHAVWA